jgi:hypothetical protein
VRELALQDIEARVRAAKAPRAFVTRSGGRPRDREEQLLLTRISVKRWQEALRTGKIVKTGPREWFYAVRQ